MPFHDILGQDDAKRLLQNALRKDAVSHAYLFTGSAGSGQMKTARCLPRPYFVPSLRTMPAGNAWSAARWSMETILILRC